MKVTLYTKEDCKLCEEAKAALESLQSEIPHQLIEIDILADPTLLERYGEQVPVVQVGPYTLRAPFTSVDLKVALSAARDSQSVGEANRARPRARGLNRLLLWFSRHWLAVFSVIVFTYASLPFAAPVLMNAGSTRMAGAIYTLYSPFCHQLGFRSWFLFGDQSAYPTERAGLRLDTFGEATGINEEDYRAARAFRGDERVGYKVALCERDVAIYGGIFLGGIAFGLVRRRLKPLPLKFWFLLGVLPIALDGGTQLLSAFPWLPLTPRESTPLLRTLTGALFGLANVWMAYPYIEVSMQDTRKAIAAKLAVARQRDQQLQTG